MNQINLKHFGINQFGNDYVVGDIHGMFIELQQKLDEIGFDEAVDRLFSVGDLVDRGPNSHLFVKWLAKPWFHAVRGNHEQMMIDGIRGTSDYPITMWITNGGKWIMRHSDEAQKLFADIADKLPLAIEVETKLGLVGIVHAECPMDDWDLFKSMYGSNVDRFDNLAMWARIRIKRKDVSIVQGLHKLYVGHTPLNNVEVLGNVVYVDTGACFEGGKFSIIKLN